MPHIGGSGFGCHGIPALDRQPRRLRKCNSWIGREVPPIAALPYVPPKA